MKLLALLLALLGFLLDAVYYIICSPYLIPRHFYRRHVNREWRKNVKVGDRCYFYNILGTRSYFTIERISEDGKKVLCSTGGVAMWNDIKDLAKI